MTYSKLTKCVLIKNFHKKKNLTENLELSPKSLYLYLLFWFLFDEKMFCNNSKKN